jgi:outer membrane protein insertion porin family
MSGGIDLFAKQNEATPYVAYATETYGTNLRLGFALTEEVRLGLRYSIYSQSIQLPPELQDCTRNNLDAGWGPTGASFDSCYDNGEASIPVKVELAQGAQITSLVGYSLNYNTVDNLQNPSKGIAVDWKQDFAGVGGDVNFIRSSIDFRRYQEVLSDVVSVLHLQAGVLNGWGGQDLRMLDNFQLGPTLVRGFAPSGIGPRDPITETALGGTKFWGASVELQYPLFFMPKEIGLKASFYADAGSLWDYQGPMFDPVTGQTLHPEDGSVVRSSVGAGIIWASPFGPLRLDYAVAITKAGYDRTQEISFGGGTKF